MLKADRKILVAGAVLSDAHHLSVTGVKEIKHISRVYVSIDRLVAPLYSLDFADMIFYPLGRPKLINFYNFTTATTF